MVNYIKLFIYNIFETFKTHGKGFSARKLTAFVVTSLIVYIHYKWLKSCYNNNHFDLLPQVLLIDFGALLCLLGLTTWEKITNLNNIASGSNGGGSSSGGGSNGPSISVDLSQTSNSTNNTSGNQRRRRRKPKQ